MVAALPDRLLHRCRIVNILGNSHRMRNYAELSEAIHLKAAKAVRCEQALTTAHS